MRKFISILSFLIFASTGNAQSAVQLSDSARISLWTVAAGSELYSTFGHSAIQVYDADNRISKVYNYGTFEFDTPNFYLKFMRGQLPYYLNVERYRDFEYGNMLEHRPMTEMVLNLNQKEKQRLFDLLEDNATEEHKFYKYEFFYDNCATRIRDIFQESMFQTLVWDSSYMRKDVTMRTLLHEHLTQMPWSEFGIDLLLGTPCDKRPKAEEYMFLPKYLGEAVQKTQTKEGLPLVAYERTLGNAQEQIKKGFDPTDPLWVMTLVALIGVLSMFHPVAKRVFDWIFWPTISAVGIVIVFLWFFSDHTATRSNFNLIWAFPAHLFFFAKSKSSEWADNYFLGIGMASLCLLLLWRWLPQELPFAAMPLLILMIIKCFHRRFEV